MIFSVVTNIAFAFLGPLGGAAVIVGDWWFNAYMVAKIVENVVPNGAAIVGNVSELFPVILNTMYSAAVPVLGINYTQLLADYGPDINMTYFQDNFTTLMGQFANVTEAMKG